MRYEISGTVMQTVSIDLDRGETAPTGRANEGAQHLGAEQRVAGICEE